MKKSLKAISSLILVLCILWNTVTIAGSGNVSISLGLPLTSDVELENLEISIAIIYDNEYHENVLKIGEELTLELTARNASTDLKTIQFFVGMNDVNGNLLEVALQDATIAAGVTETAAISRLVPKDVNVPVQAIVYIWDNLVSTEPYIAFTMLPTATDHYGNNFAAATKINDVSKRINGSISPAGDNDYIKFTVPSSGSYVIRCFNSNGGMGLSGFLHNANQSLITSNTGSDSYSITANLTAGQTYYLRTTATSVGDYFISIQPNCGFDIYAYGVEITGYKNAIHSLAKTAFDNGKRALSQEIYNKFEMAYDIDLRLHEMPPFLMNMPKTTSNYDTQVRAYFATKKTSFEELRDMYLSILSEYSNGTMSMGFTPSMTMDLDGILMFDDIVDFDNVLSFDCLDMPYVWAMAPLMIVDKEGNPRQASIEELNLIKISIEEASLSQSDMMMTTSSTPSLTISSTTSTSITYNATFPTSGAKGNAIWLIDFNQGNTISQQHGNNIYHTNGTNTISNLVPGGVYYVGIMWSTDGGNTYGYDNAVFRIVQLPYNTNEVLTSGESTYIKATLETNDKALATNPNFNTWLNRMDSVYLAFQNLTGYTPYNGGKWELKSTRENLGGYYNDGGSSVTQVVAYAGNPSVYSRPFYRSFMQRLSANDWGMVAIHELSHSFDIDAWCFDYEVLADLKLAYVLDSQSGSKVYCTSFNEYYTGSNIYNYFNSSSTGWSYNNTFAKGFYHRFGMTAVMLRIQRTNNVGWQPFMDTFRYMSNLSSEELDYVYAMPRPDAIGKFNIFMTKLQDFSGVNVFNLLTQQERNIIQAQYGGTIERYVAPPPNIGGGGQSNIHVSAGSYAIRRYIPTTSGNVNIFTAPYGGTGSGSATVIEVYADDYLNILLASNTATGNNRFARVTLNVQAHQTYFIRIRNNGGNAIVHADLKISRAPVNLALNGTADIQVSGLESSIFRFTPTTTGQYIFRTNPHGGGTQTTNRDSVLQVYSDDALTQQVARSRYRAGTFPQTNARLVAGTTYFITYSGYLGMPARARISIRNGYTATVNNHFDGGFLTRHTLTEATARTRILGYQDIANEKFRDLVGLTIANNNVVLYQSPPDLCARPNAPCAIHTPPCNNFAPPDPCTVAGTTVICTIHTPFCSERPTLRNDAFTRFPGSSVITSAIWSGNRIRSERIDGDGNVVFDFNRSFSSGTHIFMLETGTDNNITGVLIHELVHQYGGPDHYHEIRTRLNMVECVGGLICSNTACAPNANGRDPRPASCIMNNSRPANVATRAVHDMFCVGCEYDMRDHLIGHH